MRRIRQLFMTLCVMALFAGLGIPAKGEETRSAYRPVKVETVAAGDTGQGAVSPAKVRQPLQNTKKSTTAASQEAAEGV